MRLGQNTILITGGSTGIGFALAKRFSEAGSEVIVCGRREDALKEAKAKCPKLHTIRADVGTEAERKSLFETAVRRFPKLNVLVNNAGIQNRPPALLETQNWETHRQELAINLDAPMHLAMLFLPHLLKQESPAIVNVTSGLAFSPLAYMSTYCATKAALHSFTLSLRYQLKDTPIQVVEIVPPAVNTDLGGKGLHNFGVPLDDFANETMARIAKGESEVGYGFSEKGRLASREQLNEIFIQMNGMFDKEFRSRT